ncbi:SIR2 family protein [Trabulsiella odontotermitis]|uniref:SIR2 family protein n=1 Tax=Trabulsiella odontotermitis TaxID=379893 RepID=UPI0006BA387D|nr:SIR2 family protein [Trabulsiella odontotermitis]
MGDYALLVGNGINNLADGNSWFDVLQSLGLKYHITIDTNNKPFPLAYEEIYFTILKAQQSKNTERKIKGFIADKIQTITSNDIHQHIMALDCPNIMTTNYDLALETCLVNASALKNDGIIKEQKYSVFRHHQINDKRLWHIHGDITVANSITLGYEHYSGYLQAMRNYTATGSSYAKEEFNTLKPLIRRLATPGKEYSWIDNFFRRNVYIFGLTLDFVEIDLWWLLTYRERCRLLKNSDKEITNRVVYYIPACFAEDEKSTAKIALLDSVGVTVNKQFGQYFKRSKDDEKAYYVAVIADIQKAEK